MNLTQEMQKFAEYHHRNQRRDFSGEPYRNHLERVYLKAMSFSDEIPGVVSENDLDEVGAIIWGHDLIEDTKKNAKVITYDIILSEFTKGVADGILDLTNVYTPDNFPDLNREVRKQKECDRIAQIPNRSKFIKLCDRFDNITSYEREDPEWGVKHFYLPETELLLTALIGVHTELYNSIRAVIECAKRGR